LRVFSKLGKEAVSQVCNLPKFINDILIFIALHMNQAKHADDWVNLSLGSQVEKLPDRLCEDDAFMLGMRALKILCQVENLLDDCFGHETSSMPGVFLSFLELPVEAEVSESGFCMSFFAKKLTIWDRVLVSGAICCLR